MSEPALALRPSQEGSGLEELKDTLKRFSRLLFPASSDLSSAAPAAKPGAGLWVERGAGPSAELGAGLEEVTNLARKEPNVRTGNPLADSDLKRWTEQLSRVAPQAKEIFLGSVRRWLEVTSELAPVKIRSYPPEVLESIQPPDRYLYSLASFEAGILKELWEQEGATHQELQVYLARRIFDIDVEVYEREPVTWKSETLHTINRATSPIPGLPGTGKIVKTPVPKAPYSLIPGLIRKGIVRLTTVESDVPGQPYGKGSWGLTPTTFRLVLAPNKSVYQYLGYLVDAAEPVAQVTQERDWIAADRRIGQLRFLTVQQGIGKAFGTVLTVEDPKAIAWRLAYNPEAVTERWRGVKGKRPRSELPPSSKTVQQFLHDPTPWTGQPWSVPPILAMDALQVSFWADDPDYLLVVDGKIVHTVEANLDREFWIFVLKPGPPRLERLTVDQIKARGIRWGMSGPALRYQKEDLTDQPERLSKLVWDPSETAAGFSVIGATQDGKVLLATFAGIPVAQPEITLKAVSQVMAEQGAVDLLLLGGSMDAQMVYADGTRQGYILASHRAYPHESNRPLNAILYAVPAEPQGAGLEEPGRIRTRRIPELGILAARVSKKGSKHELNQDRVRWEVLKGTGNTPIGFLAVVADGMGGLPAGETAAEKVVHFILKSLKDRQSAAYAMDLLEWYRHVPPDQFQEMRNTEEKIQRKLQRAFEVAHFEIVLTGMDGGPVIGSTATLILLVGDTAFVAWVGDAQAYHFREGRLVWKTQQDDRTKGTHALKNHLGIRGAAEVHHGLLKGLKPGDRVAVLVDGIYDKISDPVLAEILGRESTPETQLEGLLTAASHGTDDQSGVIVEMEPPTVSSPKPGPLAPESWQAPSQPEAGTLPKPEDSPSIGAGGGLEEGGIRFTGLTESVGVNGLVFEGEAMPLARVFAVAALEHPVAFAVIGSESERARLISGLEEKAAQILNSRFLAADGIGIEVAREHAERLVSEQIPPEKLPSLVITWVRDRWENPADQLSRLLRLMNLRFTGLEEQERALALLSSA